MSILPAAGPEGQAQPHSGGAGRAPGLVSTQQVISGLVAVDRKVGRIRRMRRSVITSARLLQEQLGGSGFRWKPALLTLTYRPGVEWSRRHVSELVAHIRAYLAARDHELHYVWVAELQVRGAVHYHVVVWLPSGLTLPKPDKRGWWRHGSTRIEWARRAVAYIAKYCSKGADDRDSAGGSDRAFPRGLRVCGSGGLDAERRSSRCWWLLPRYVRELFGVDLKPRRVAGGGYVATAVGEWCPAKYLYHSVRDGFLWLRPNPAFQAWALQRGVTATTEGGSDELASACAS